MPEVKPEPMPETVFAYCIDVLLVTLSVLPLYTYFRRSVGNKEDISLLYRVFEFNTES